MVWLEHVQCPCAPLPQSTKALSESLALFLISACDLTSYQVHLTKLLHYHCPLPIVRPTAASSIAHLPGTACHHLTRWTCLPRRRPTAAVVVAVKLHRQPLTRQQSLLVCHRASVKHGSTMTRRLPAPLSNSGAFMNSSPNSTRLFGSSPTTALGIY
jgi:hypothetical protein